MISKKKLAISFLLFICSYLGAQLAPSALENSSEVDAYLSRIMDSHNIPGLAVAIVQDGKVVYKNYLGVAELGSGQKVDESTMFRVFSTTKLITATAIFQLIQEGRLTLEDQITSHLSHLPVAWEDVRIKNLLSHSSGLPDIIRYESSLSDIELLDKLDEAGMTFEVGSQFRYNQTNYWLLAQVVEKLAGLPFEEYVVRNQFNNASEGILFSSNSQEEIPNRAMRYNFNKKTGSFEEDGNNNGRRAHGGNGLNITLDRFIEWNEKLDAGDLLDTEARASMWSPFDYENEKDDFLHGWGTYHNNRLESYGFTGGNLAAFRKFVDSRTTIIMLSNGYEIPAYDVMVNDLSRMVIPGLQEQDLILEEGVMNQVLDGQYDKAQDLMTLLKKENPKNGFDNLKWNVNSVGNALMAKKKPQEARAVFSFNAAAYPTWWVSTAGVAETYEAEGKIGKAVESYEEAILLNVDNEWDYNKVMSEQIDKLKKE